MTTRRTRTIVPYTAEEMFDLVADVERYPEFIPYCQALRVVQSERTLEGGTMLADMIVGYRGFRETFRSRIALDRKGLTIETTYVEGPIRRLHNLWRFRDLDEGSEVDFTIDFELKSMLLQATVGLVFEKAFAKMSEAFVRRAHAVYGQPEDIVAGRVPRRAP